MAAITRHRLPLLALALIFLIPVGMSTLRGISHVLTCEDEVGTPISIVPGPDKGQPPIVASSQIFEAGQDSLICESLTVELAVGEFSEARGAVELIVGATNRSDVDWHGTMQLKMGRDSIPLPIGKVQAGQSVQRSAWVRGFDDQLEIDGTLLIGP